MFSAWDFNSWISSIGVVLVMLFLLTGFSALMSALTLPYSLQPLS